MGQWFFGHVVILAQEEEGEGEGGVQFFEMLHQGQSHLDYS